MSLSPVARHTPLVSPAPRMVALVLGRLDRARLVDAARGLVILDFVDTLAELEEAVLRGAPVVAIVLAEPFDKTRTPSAPLITRLSAVRPDLALIAYLTRGNAADFLALARAGAHDVVFRGEDTTRSVRDALARSGAEVAGASVLRALESTMSADALALVGYCLEYAHARTTTDDVARHLGVHRKTLVQRCRVAGLPAPGALLVWVRLMVAASMLEAPGRLVEDVAEALSLRSPSVLRNAFKRYTGRRATELREAGGLAAVIAAFRHPKAYGREAGRRRSREAFDE